MRLNPFSCWRNGDQPSAKRLSKATRPIEVAHSGDRPLVSATPYEPPIPALSSNQRPLPTNGKQSPVLQLPNAPVAATTTLSTDKLFEGVMFLDTSTNTRFQRFQDITAQTHAIQLFPENSDPLFSPPMSLSSEEWNTLYRAGFKPSGRANREIWTRNTPSSATHHVANP